MANPPTGLNLEDYLNCVATTSGTCQAPSDPVFDQQQVSMVAVYQRCLANYQSKQWDLGAYVLFNSTLRKTLNYQVPTPTTCTRLSNFQSPTTGSNCIGDCLMYSQSQGSDASPCLDYFLQDRNEKDIEYFEYSNNTGATLSHEIDACQVFTGPAQLPQGQSFRQCLNEYSDTGQCQLPLIVWSGRSQNKVPVGQHHATRITSEAAKITAAQRVYREVRDSVKSLLDKLNGTWNANNLKVPMT